MAKEPSSANAVQLLDDDGAITIQACVYVFSASRRYIRIQNFFFQLETCLKHIFAKYCSPSASRLDKKMLLQPPHNASLSPEGLDAWAKDTNGAPFSQETKDELVEFLDVAEDGSLTWEKDASQKFPAPQLYQPAWKDFWRFISYKLKMTRKKLGGI